MSAYLHISLTLPLHLCPLHPMLPPPHPHTHTPAPNLHYNAISSPPLLSVLHLCIYLLSLLYLYASSSSSFHLFSIFLISLLDTFIFSPYNFYSSPFFTSVLIFFYYISMPLVLHLSTFSLSSYSPYSTPSSCLYIIPTPFRSSPTHFLFTLSYFYFSPILLYLHTLLALRHHPFSSNFYFSAFFTYAFIFSLYYISMPLFLHLCTSSRSSYSHYSTHSSFFLCKCYSSLFFSYVFMF